MIIWDIGGDEKWKERLRFYLKGADGAIVVYDITRKNSFNNLSFWEEKIENNAGQIPFIMVGNKMDLREDRKVQLEEALNYLKNKNCDLFETSAKTGETVNEIFKTIASKIVISKAKKSKG